MKNYLKSFSILISFIINPILSINLQKTQCNKNIHFPSCKDCKHFILDKENIEKGKCDLTYLTSLVTRGVFRKLQTPAAPHPGQALLGAAEKIYNYALLNRMNILSCGFDGKFYEYISDIEQLDSSKIKEVTEESDKNN